MFDNKTGTPSKLSYSPITQTTYNKPKNKLSQLDIYLNMYKPHKELKNINNPDILLQNGKLHKSSKLALRTHTKIISNFTASVSTAQKKESYKNGCIDMNGHQLDSEEAVFFVNGGSKGHKMEQPLRYQHKSMNHGDNQQKRDKFGVDFGDFVDDHKSHNNIHYRRTSNEKPHRKINLGAKSVMDVAGNLTQTPYYTNLRTTLKDPSFQTLTNKTNYNIKFSKMRANLHKEQTVPTNIVEDQNLCKIGSGKNLIKCNEQREHKRTMSGTKWNNKEIGKQKDAGQIHKIQRINIQSLIQRNRELKQSNFNSQIPLLQRQQNEKTRPIFIVHHSQTIKNKRNYNEDRSISKQLVSPYAPNSFQKGKSTKTMLYGVFDGHGGSACSQFIQKNLPTFLQNSKLLLTDPLKCLEQSLRKIEEEFLKICERKGYLQISGSTATVCLLINKANAAPKLLIGNIGDSRIWIIGQSMKRLTKDHKPEEEGEKKRIIRNGGKLYKEQITSRGSIKFFQNDETNKDEAEKNSIKKFSQTRILPGNLNVSRTIGDIEVKMKKYGGSPGIVIADPDLLQMELNVDEYDTIILGSDGLYEGLSDSQIFKIYQTQKQQRSPGSTSEQFCQKVAKNLITASSIKSTDNITLVIVHLYNK